MSSIYNELETRSIDIYNNHVHITEDHIISVLEDCYNNTAFSTFPYFFHNYTSEQAINNMNSGNCIALSIYVKQKLKEKYNINSCLIPATIPKKYQRSSYLDISHVALVIPIDNSPNDSGFFIADPAFYFINPIEINIKDFSPKIVFGKNIYTKDYTDDYKKYKSIDKILIQLDHIHTDKKFNNWQTIKAGTYFIRCFEVDDPLDTWSYFLTEIVNPDEAITTFFLIEQKPFITSTNGDQYGFPQMGGYLKLDNNIVTYTKNHKNEKIINLVDDDSSGLDEINRDVGRFLHGELKQYVSPKK